MIYIADTCERYYIRFYRSFINSLDQNQIAFSIIQNTRDVWCRDYMPIKLSEGRFIQFDYDPQMLRTKKNSKYKTDPELLKYKIEGEVIKRFDIKLEGGSIEINEQYAFVSEIVVEDNPKLKLTELETIFNREVIILPRMPYEPTGHLDSLVRFCGERRVLLNQFTKEWKQFERNLHDALPCDLDVVSVPWYAARNSSSIDCTGEYLNFLELSDQVLVPDYGLGKKQVAVFDLFKELFPSKSIIPIDALGICKHGGVIHCVTWEG